jgi:hypothetical protein
MTATLVVNVDLGNYSPMFGAAQRLSNGDYVFTSGAQGKAPNLISQSIEVRPDGTKAYVLQANKGEFRTFRVRTLYQGVRDQLAGAGGGEESGDGDDFQGTSHGDRPRPDGLAGASLAALKGFSDDFGPGIMAALNGPPGQPAIPAAIAVASSDSAISGIAAPPVPVGDPHADPAFSDLSHDVTGAASDALFADGGKDPCREAVGDDLARALSP